MPLTSTATLAQLKAEALAFVRTRFPGKASGLTSFLGKIANVISMALFGLQRTAENIDLDSPPQAKSSRNGLVQWADTSGLPSNAGGFGPNLSSAASGGLASVTGTGGTNVGAGQQLVAPDGTTIVELSGLVVIPATGSFDAVTKGTVGNLPVGTVLTWLTPPAGCDPTVTLTSAMSGGFDLETSADLFSRLQTRFQVPPKGGADVDYKTWSESRTGIFRAYVYPRRQGTGSTDTVLMSAGSGVGRIPTSGQVADVQAYVDSIRPTNEEEFFALKPQHTAGNDLTIKARGIPALGYKWDWDDTSSSWTVAGYSAGTPSLTLNAAAPQSLIDSVTQGLKPRIQVWTTTASAHVVPEQRLVVAIDAGHTILTLDSAFAIAPTNGDTVKAGSYVATIVAQAMLNYVDGLGPSRLGGFASTVLPWDDLVSIFRLGNAALDATDTDGRTRLLSNLVSGSVTIAVGAGSPAATDYEPPDPTPASVNPEFAVVKLVAVYQ